MAQASDMRVLSCSGSETACAPFSGVQYLIAPVQDLIEELPSSHASALRAAMSNSAPEEHRVLVAAAVHLLLMQLARREPVLVVVDDAQWLDNPSLDALRYVARQVNSHAALLFGIWYSHPEDGRIGDLPELAVRGLDYEAATALLEERGWQASTRGTLIAATGGNPLALTELADERCSDDLASEIALSGRVPLGTRLQNLLSRRISWLPAEVQRALLVIASEVDCAYTAVLGSCRRLGISPEAVESVEHEVLVDIDAMHVRFRNPLLASAVYQRAPFVERSRVHLAWAEELECAGKHSWAARHRAALSEEPDEELAAALEAGAEEVQERRGNAAATALLCRAAELSPGHGEQGHRTVTAAYTAWQSGQLPLARTLVQRALQIGSSALPTARLLRLRSVVEHDSDEPAETYPQLTRAAEAAAEENPREALSLLFMAVEAGYLAACPENSARAVERMLELPCEPCDLFLVLWLERALFDELPLCGTTPEELVAGSAPFPEPYEAIRPLWVTALSWLGPHQRLAREYAVQTCREFRVQGVLSVLPVMLNWLADIEYHLGLWTSGTAHAKEAIRLARETGQHTRTADGLAHLARFAAVRGDDEVSCYVDRALESGLAQGNRAAVAHASWAAGLAALVRGENEDAYQRLRAIARPGSAYYHPRVAAQVYPELVEAALRAEETAVAVDLTGRFSADSGSAAGWPDAHRHLCHGLVEGAQERFVLAARAAEAAERPFESARIALLYGEWARRQRRPAELCRGQLLQAAERFDSLGATLWADRAREQLRASGGGSARRMTESDLGKLTEREKQIASLAASGMSNREIGSRLFISPRTVGDHLYKIFPKLGVSSRAQLRAFHWPELDQSGKR